MKAHSVKSNAKRAARKFCEEFDGFQAVEPVAAPDGGWLPVVRSASRLPSRERALVERYVVVEWPLTKSETIVKLVSRKNGATPAELREATGWLPHTVRGYIGGTLRKRGFRILNVREGMASRYVLDASERGADAHLQKAGPP